VELLGFHAFKRVCYTCCDPLDCLTAGSSPGDADGDLPPCSRRR
jgi:hypothetical protein